MNRLSNNYYIIHDTRIRFCVICGNQNIMTFKIEYVDKNVKNNHSTTFTCIKCRNGFEIKIYE